MLSLDDAKTAYYGYVQPKEKSLTDYLRHFQSLLEVLEHYNVSIGEDNYFLDKAGVLMDDEEPDLTEPNYAEMPAKYNAKKTCVARNRSIVD